MRKIAKTPGLTILFASTNNAPIQDTLKVTYENAKNSQRIILIDEKQNIGDDTPLFQVVGTDLYIQKQDKDSILKNDEETIEAPDMFDYFWVDEKEKTLLYHSLPRGIFDQNNKTVIDRSMCGTTFRSKGIFWNVKNYFGMTRENIEVFKNDVSVYEGNFGDTCSIVGDAFVIKTMDNLLLKNGNPDEVLFSSNEPFKVAFGKTTDDFFIIQDHNVSYRGVKPITGLGAFENFYVFDTDKYITVRNKHFFLNGKGLCQQSGETSTSIRHPGEWMPFRYIINELGIIQFNKKGGVYLTVIK